MTMKYIALVIGGSAGSLEALIEVLPGLKGAMLPAIIIIVHRKVSNDYSLPNLLALKTNLPVKEVEEKEKVIPGVIYIAPADYHLLIEHDCTFSLDDSEKVNYSRPSIDITFESAAEVYGSGLAAILLSGANADGVAGLQTIKELGGLVAAQDPESAEVAYMPQQAVNRIALDRVLKTEEIATFINELN